MLDGTVQKMTAATIEPRMRMVSIVLMGTEASTKRSEEAKPAPCV